MNLIKYNIALAVVGSPDIYLAVRAAFVNQGTTLNKWCLSNGVSRQSAEKALKGERVGKTALELVDRIVSVAFPESRSQ